MINRLKKIRKSRGYTQLELAYICGTTRETIGRIENNKVTPGLWLVLRLEEVFGGAWSFTLDQKELSELHQRMNDVYCNHFPDECL